MSKQESLKLIITISLIGIMFSGYLSYMELFAGSCNLGFVGCGTNTGLIAGLPACVYGLVMYTVVFVVSVLGFKSKK